MSEPLITPEEAAIADDDALALTIQVLFAEQTRRARESGDPEALADEAFEGRGFETSGRPRLPYLVEGLLVCPGGKMEKSASSHDCTFVAVGDTWAWENDEVVYDDMRQVPGSKWRRSVTVVAATEGMTFDVVASQSRSGSRCQMKSARSFEVRAGNLVETQVRARAAGSHR